MAEGVKIRIVGDDSDFIRTLQTLESRARNIFSGLGIASQLSENFRLALEQATGQLSVDLSVNGSLAEGIAGQRSDAETAAQNVAQGVNRSLQNRMGAYAAGVAAGEGYLSGLLSRRAAIVAAAQSMANAASAAMQGAGSASVSVGTPQRTLGMALPGVQTAPAAAGSAPAAEALGGMQPIYLNVDGRTLAQVLSGDMRTSINRRARSMDMGVGR